MKMPREFDYPVYKDSGDTHVHIDLCECGAKARIYRQYPERYCFDCWRGVTK